MVGWQELVIIFIIVLLIFGGKKIPEVARGLGKGFKEFKKAKDDISDSLKESVKDDKQKDDESKDYDELKVNDKTVKMKD